MIVSLEDREVPKTNTPRSQDLRDSASDVCGFRRRRPFAYSSVFRSRFRSSSHRNEQLGLGSSRWIGGFTLIELLTVIAIIGILAAILIPVVANVRSAARTAQATSNVREIGGLTHIYMNENGDHLPSDLFGGIRPPWIQELWQIAYPQVEFPEFGADIGGDVFRDSVFHTPLLEQEAADGRQPRSFGWSVDLRVNTVGSLSGGNDRAHLSRIRNPTRTVVLADSISSSAIRPTTNQINYRNNGRALFLFVDGHVEALRPEQVPSNPRHVFWGGDQDSDGPTPRR